MSRAETKGRAEAKTGKRRLPWVVVDLSRVISANLKVLAAGLPASSRQTLCAEKTNPRPALRG